MCCIINETPRPNVAQTSPPTTPMCCINIEINPSKLKNGFSLVESTTIDGENHWVNFPNRG